jgi:hypothetical protein
MEGYILRDLERLSGIDHRTLVRRWIEPGLLVGGRRSGRGPYLRWLFDLTLVQNFLRAHSNELRPKSRADTRWVTLVHEPARDGLVP